MPQITHIYKKEIDKISLIDSLNYTIDEFKANPKGCFPDWDTETMIASEIKYEYPIISSEEEGLREMTLFERYKNGLYELGEHQVEYEGDIITLEPGQFINPQGKLQTVEKIEGTRVEWNWELNKWEDVATDLEVAELQYAEYDALDKPSVIDEMNLLDPTLGQELKNMLIELRGIISALKEQQSMTIIGYSSIHIPEPSKKLEDFKNKFDKFKK